MTGTALGGTVSRLRRLALLRRAPRHRHREVVNGDDADAAPGPLVAVGDPVDWTYKVTNTGNVPLQLVADRRPRPGQPRTARGILILPVGQTVTCHAARPAARRPASTKHRDGDRRPAPARHRPSPTPTRRTTSASTGSIDIEKSTNGDDADKAPGPFIALGGPVTWTYRGHQHRQRPAHQRRRRRPAGRQRHLPGDHARSRRLDDLHRRRHRSCQTSTRTSPPSPANTALGDAVRDDRPVALLRRDPRHPAREEHQRRRRRRRARAC